MSSAGGLFTLQNYDEHRFQPQAALLYDSQSRPVVLRLNGNSLVVHQRQSDGRWTESSISAAAAGSSFALFAAAMGPSDKLHVALIQSGDSPALSHGSNQSGSWQWSRVTTVAGNPRGFIRQSYAPRFFSLAVDSRNAAHLAFASNVGNPTGPQGYPRPFSELAYASNRSGQWQVQVIQTVADRSGDAGLGASIAIGADDEPAMASFYNERADTGSSQWSQLLFHRRNSSGQWSSSSVARTADNYAAGDGNHGSGFAPYLRFDPRGRPHIVFSDHASEHFWQSGQNEFAGQIRHAHLEVGQWAVRTLTSQSSPLQQQMIYPAFAVRNGELAYLSLRRDTVWPADSWPRLPAISTYRLLFNTASAPN